MNNAIVDIERTYYSSFLKPNVNVDEILDMNELYCDELFKLYEKTIDEEEKIELEYEIEYTIDQARVLRNIQLNNPEESA